MVLGKDNGCGWDNGHGYGNDNGHGYGNDKGFGDKNSKSRIKILLFQLWKILFGCKALGENCFLFVIVLSQSLEKEGVI